MLKKKLVVIGAGLIGREHCDLVRAHPGSELVGIADISKVAQQYAEEINTPYFSNYLEMLDESSANGAIIALPNAFHSEAGCACISRGIPCLVEKPIADSVFMAERLVEASESSGVAVLVGHHRRHSPDIHMAKRLIQDGLIGRVIAVNGMWLADKPENYFSVNWRRMLGGGPLLINLIHEIDCLRFILGEIKSVCAFTSNEVRSFEVEDTASVTMRFENGALGSFIISDAVPSPYTWEMASGQALYLPHQPGDCYYFGGSKATLSVPSMTLWAHDGDKKNWQDPIFSKQLRLESSSAYHNQLDHFLAILSGDVEPLINARDGMMSLAATRAVEMAAREDRTVDISQLLS